MTYVPRTRRLKEKPAILLVQVPAWIRGVPAVASACVALLLIALPAVACASLPDSVWIPGIYDSADSDEAVMACLSAAAVAGPIMPAKPGITRGVSEGPIGPPLITPAPRSTSPSRAPPA